MTVPFIVLLFLAVIGMKFSAGQWVAAVVLAVIGAGLLGLIVPGLKDENEAPVPEEGDREKQWRE